MGYSLIGGALIIAGCGGVGFRMAASHRQEEKTFHQINTVLDYITCELQCHLTPLPVLCQQASREVSGPISTVFNRLSQELERQISPDVSACMEAALSSLQLSRQCDGILRQLGNSLGRFDLPGQLKELEHIRSLCRREIKRLEDDRDNRLRSYQTLGLCAGAALAILLV